MITTDREQNDREEATSNTVVIRFDSTKRDRSPLVGGFDEETGKGVEINAPRA
jgi:hypothetical protein